MTTTLTRASGLLLRPMDYDLPVALRLPGKWTRDALCLEHTELNFFPDRGEPTARAKGVCSRCAVRDECRNYAIEQHIAHGIFGGTTGRQRMSIWRASGDLPRVATQVATE